MPAQHEFDGNDYQATHIIVYSGDEPIGTLRIRWFKDFAKSSAFLPPGLSRLPRAQGIRRIRVRSRRAQGLRQGHHPRAAKIRQAVENGFRIQERRRQEADLFRGPQGAIYRAREGPDASANAISASVRTPSFCFGPRATWDTPAKVRDRSSVTAMAEVFDHTVRVESSGRCGLPPLPSTGKWSPSTRRCFKLLFEEDAVPWNGPGRAVSGCWESRYSDFGTDQRTNSVFPFKIKHLPETGIIDARRIVQPELVGDHGLLLPKTSLSQSNTRRTGRAYRRW